MMRIDIWSDYVCPWCYIGKRELDNAVEGTGMEDQVSIEYHASELNPDAPTEQTLLFYDHLQEKRGVTLEEAKQSMEQVVERAASLDLDYHFENLYQQNTHKAHRLAEYAREVGKAAAYHERLFHAVFTENAFLSDTKTLVKLGKEIGLDTDEVLRIVEDKDAYAEEVEQDKSYAARLGIQRVPFYIFNNRYSVSGAQKQEVFEELLEKVARELKLN